MKKLIKNIRQFIGNITYFLSYSASSIDNAISKDRRALKIAIHYPISPEDVKDILDVTDAFGIEDKTVEKLLGMSSSIGVDGKGFVLDVVCTLRVELRKANSK